MLHRSIRRIAPYTLLIPALLSAEPINIAGKLTDASGKPIPLATVTLKNYTLSATTDENGLYHIKGETTPIVATTKTISVAAPRMIGSTLTFAITQARSVQIELFSLSGRKVGATAQSLPAGTHTIDPFESINIGSGVYLIRYSDGISSATFKAVSNGSNPGAKVAAPISQTAHVSKSVRAEPSADTLIVKSKEGSEITAVPLRSLVDSLPTLFIVQRNIGGTFSKTATRGVGKITATLTEQGQAPRTMKLGFNKANNSYSGFVYSLYSADTKNYAVQVNVFAADTLLSGKSTVVEYTSDLGNVDVPAFDPNNATPAIAIQPLPILSQGDTVVAPFNFDFLPIDSMVLFGKNRVEWKLGTETILIDTIAFDNGLDRTEQFKLPVQTTKNWALEDTLSVTVTAQFDGSFSPLSATAENKIAVNDFPLPVADSLKIVATKDSLRGSWSFSSKDPFMVQGETIIRWLKNGARIDSGKTVIAIPENLLNTDEIVLEITPVAKSGVRKIGTPKQVSRTGIGRDQMLDEFLANMNSYNANYRYPFADTLGARGGIGNGGFRDSWGTETQIQIAIPKANFTVNGTSLNFSIANAPYYWMGVATMQELCGFDMQVAIATGSKESFAGTTINYMGGYISGEYGPFQIEPTSALDRALGYTAFYPTHLEKLNAAQEVIYTGINPTNFAEYYLNKGEISQPSAVNSALMYAQILSVTDRALENSTKLFWNETLKSAKDPYLGVSVLLGMYNLGLWGTIGTAANIFSESNWEATASNPTARDLFPVGNNNYRNEILSVTAQLVSASKLSLSDTNIAIIDFSITKQQLNDLFFGENGTVALQGKGGILQHWHLDATDPVRQTIANQINSCFEKMQGKAPSTAGKEEISFRYDLLFILRSVKQYLPFNPPVPTKGDAGYLIKQYSN